MSFLPPPLEILQRTRLYMHMGKSVAASLKGAVEGRDDDFSKSLRAWSLRVEAGQDPLAVADQMPALNSFPQRRHLLNVLQRGMCGAAIDGFLEEMESEFFFVIETDFKRKLQLLPVKMLMPLTLCILPGVLILIAGPFLYAMKGV